MKLIHVSTFFSWSDFKLTKKNKLISRTWINFEFLKIYDLIL